VFLLEEGIQRDVSTFECKTGSNRHISTRYGYGVPEVAGSDVTKASLRELYATYMQFGHISSTFMRPFAVHCVIIVHIILN